MDKMETAVLLSGGLDSSVALHWAHRNHRVRVALSFDYASNHAERELKCAAWQAASLGIEHRVIDISSISSHLKSALLSGADDIPDGSYDEELMKQIAFNVGIIHLIAKLCTSKIVAHKTNALCCHCRKPTLSVLPKQ